MSPATQKIPNAMSWPRPLPATILLVEDEAAVREVTREALEMGGCRVLEAGRPQAATHGQQPIGRNRPAAHRRGDAGDERPRVGASRQRNTTRFGNDFHERLRRKRNHACGRAHGVSWKHIRSRLRLTDCWRKWLKHWRRAGAAQTTGTRLRSSPPRSVFSARLWLPMNR
jgi:hypothetical protein